MVNKMVIFEPDELEIAIVTYNRCEFIKEWLFHCYEQIKKRNIRLSIYDSSTNDNTKEYISDFIKSDKDKIIEYYHIDSNVNIGYKPMFPILNTKAKYIWVSGDSRCHDFNYLDEKVFPYLKLDIDYVVFHVVNNEENDGRIYTDKDELLKDCFLSMTCIGLSIYKTSLFEPLKSNYKLRNECDCRFEKNYAFAWIGYFLEMFSIGEHNALFSIIPIISLRREDKIQSWFKRCYGCWIEDLCNLMDMLSEKYKHTESVIRDTWKYMPFSSPEFCYKVRKTGDLNVKVFKKYKENGMLNRVTSQVEIIEKFSSMSDDELEQCFKFAVDIEKKNFEKICQRCIPKIKDSMKKSELWIYGAGKGGKILLKYLDNYNVHVSGFIDINAENIKLQENLPVKTINEIDSKNSFIIISFFYWKTFIIKFLLEHGIPRDKIYYMIIEDD